MVRPPCCDKISIKKGPWTPEEDIVLVSYIQEHGPGNWRSVPLNTGLMRCSKSCRLRWTNYLRPGIKRGNFTRHEEGIIIHLQSMLGNKWAAIASYLPQRTDNDIKNYWNTHLKKKFKKYQTSNIDRNSYVSQLESESNMPKLNTIQDSTVENNSQNASSTLYASSTENISKLLENWMKPNYEAARETQDDQTDSFMLFDNIERPEKEKRSTDRDAQLISISYLEKWLLDETPGPLDGFMEISSVDCSCTGT
ncbi:hypothetical protein LUZ60_004011 [Juncus effusus]|nr:hypothetical protein LUZ60_004011 [Juncus effusus]